MSLSFRTICERMRAHAIYIGEGLLFPPATEAEIQACEERLGFKLPSMMRELYTTVANGSDFFGWGYNFYTVSDDFARKYTDYPILGKIVGDGPRPFDDATVEVLRTHPGAFVVCKRIPAGFVDFASLGCEVFAYLDGLTGHIYISDNHSTNGEPDGLAFSFGASSLEEWLERWFTSSPDAVSEGRFQPLRPLAEVLAEDSTRPIGQESDNITIPESPIRQMYSEVSGYRAHLNAGLERARAVITQQIYDLDIMQESIVTRDVNNRPRPYDTSHIMQQLADLEAQIDRLLMPYTVGR